MPFITEEEVKFNRFKLDFDTVIASLEKVKGRANQKLALCPAHGDSSASLSIKRSDDGQAIIYCHAGCSYESIVRAMGLWQESSPKRIESHIVDTYDYTDEAGNLLYQVVRYEPKDFRQRRKDSTGKWIFNLDGIQRVLYKLPDLIQPSAEPVFIVEGEKDANNLASIGAIATTNSGGAGKWERSFNKYFANRDVIILPDNDPTGLEHAEKVSKEIYRSASSVKIVVVGDSAKEDISDFIENGNTLDDLLYLCRDVEALRYTEEDLSQDPSQSHNLEAEKAVLGAVFENPILISRIVEEQLETHLFDAKTKIVAKAMRECFEQSLDINHITVGEQIGKSTFDRIGGYDYLKSLSVDLPQVFDINSWVKIIISKSQYRELVTAGKKLSTLAEHEAQSITNLTDGILDKVFRIKGSEKRNGLLKIGSIVDDVIIQARNAVGKGLTGLSSGFIDLDYATSGFQKTDLIIIAGRPSMGKTSIAVNIGAYAAIHKQKSVAIFSLEMSRAQLASKIICGEAFVNSFDFRNGTMSQNAWERVIKHLPKIEEAPLFIDDTPGIGVNELRSKALRMASEETGLDLVIVDYLQLMTGRGDNRQQEISQISRDLKGLAKELDIPVIALSQLSRAPEGRANSRPLMSDLRESGSIEQDADVVAFCYRPEYYDSQDTSLAGLAEVIIAKQRNGPIGTIELAFVKEYTKFMNMVDENA